MPVASPFKEKEIQRVLVAVPHTRRNWQRRSLQFERKSRELQSLYQDLNEEMGKAELEARKMFLKDLEGIIATIAEQDNINLILERRSVGIIYFSGVMDITDKVVVELNKLKP